jgi:hypothetical protein
MVMTQHTLNKYKHRCELNRECFLILETIDWLPGMNTIIVYSKFESVEDQSNSEWLGFVTTIKNFIHKQNQSLTNIFHTTLSK